MPHLSRVGVVATAISTLGLLACEREGSTASDGVQVDTVSGVVLVSNPGPSVVHQPTLAFSIGSAMSEGPDEFGVVPSVISDNDGRIYVADETANQIQVFDRTGRFERSIGREGQGPGEFAHLYSLAWIGDTLAAFDPRNARISLFEQHEHVGQFRSQALTGDRRVVRLYPTGSAEFAALAIVPTGGSVEQHIVRWGHAGVIDTVPYPPSRFPADDRTRGGSTISCEYSGGAGIEFIDVPFMPRELSVPAPGGLTAVAWTADYRIAFTTASGDTVRVIERDYEPHATNDVEWEEGLQPFYRVKEADPAAECTPERVTRPPLRPAIHLIFFDGMGRLWVEVQTDRGRRLDAFGPDGIHLASYEAPRRVETRVPWVDENRLYIVAHDELDITYIQVYDLHAP